MKYTWLYTWVGIICFTGCGLSAPETPKKDEAPKKEEAPQGLSKQYEALSKTFDKDQEVLFKEFQAAKGDKEKKAIQEKGIALESAYSAKVIELASKNPKEDATFEALQDILASQMRGSEAAVPLLLKDHLTRPGMGILSYSIAQGEPPTGKLLELIQAVATKHPTKLDQGLAKLVLGEVQKNATWEGSEADRKKAYAEAEKYFVDVETNYGTEELKPAGQRKKPRPLGELAKKNLFELRNLTSGKVAPDVEGEDSAGKKLKLSDFRGKVVVLDFWAGWCGPCMALVPHERKMVKRLEGKPFAFLGVNVDDSVKELQEIEKEHEITWRSFFDGSKGKICETWNIRYYPTVYVLDHKGVIRFKDVREEALDKVVDQLLSEMEKK